MSEVSQKQQEEVTDKRQILVFAPSQAFARNTVEMIDENCRALAQLGYRITLVEPFEHTEFVQDHEFETRTIDGYDRIRVYGWSRLQGTREALCQDNAEAVVLRLLAQIKPDLVDVQHCSVFGADIIRVAKQAGYPVTVAINDFWLFLPTETCPYDMTVKMADPVRLKATVELINTHADQVIAATRSLYHFAVDCGIDRTRLSLQHASSSLVDRLVAMPLSKRPLDILTLNFAFIGQINEDSGLSVLLDALSQVHEAIGFQTILNLYSDDKKSDYYRQLDIEHIDNRSFGVVTVKRHHRLPVLQDILSKTDVLVIPNLADEGYSHLIEYSLASKVPVVCTHLNNHREHFKDHIQGRYVAPNDVASLTDVLNDLIDHPFLIYQYQTNIRRPRLWGEWASAEYLRLCILFNDTVEPGRVVKRLNVKAGELAQREEEKNLYHSWLDKHSLREIDGQFMAERMLTWGVMPSFQLIIPVRQGEETLLATTINGLDAQLYKRWKVSIVAASPAPGEIFNQTDLLQWFEVASDDLIMTGVNEIIKDLEMDWVTLVEPGTVFSLKWLFDYGDYINIHPEWNLIYTDDDCKLATEDHTDPKFKPDINLDLIRSYNYIGSLVVIRTFVLQSFDGYTTLPGVATHDAVLKTLDYCGEKAIGHIANLLVHHPVFDVPKISSNEINQNTKTILNDHFVRNKISASVYDGLIVGTFRTVYHHESTPMVSIIIPSKDMVHLIRDCVRGIFEKTGYSCFEVIVVDNQSQAEDTFDFYEEMKAKYPDQFRVISYPHPFNYSAMNNIAVAEAKGDYVLMLNNDIQIIQDSWLERMVAHAQRPEVGIVGVRLVTLNQHIQHAGVVLGMRDIAGHIYSGASLDAPGHLNRAQVDQNMSCVTAACMMVRKSIYEAVSGFDQVDLKVQYNDVDLNLKVGKLGYKIVWTPYVTLVHYGSVSQVTYKTNIEVTRDTHEKDIMLRRWLPELKADTAFNRNLCLSDTRSIFEPNFEVSWDPNFRAEMRVLGLPCTLGPIGEHRMFAPFRNLNDTGLIDCAYLPPMNMSSRVPTLVEFERWDVDTMLLQTTVTDTHLNLLRRIQKYSHAFKVFDLEDLKTTIPDKNSQKPFLYPEIKRRVREGLSYCDRLICTTEPIKQAYSGMIDDIKIVPIYLERSRWGQVSSLRRQSDKPRVGWVGAQQHLGDLELIFDVVKQTSKAVDWIFMGMCPEEIKPYVAESHGAVLFEAYPEKMASLNLDLAIAPLEYHPFNEAKSHLRLLEYGIMGWPVVCTDILPYQNGPVKCVKNNTKDWVEAIMERVNDLDYAAQEGDALKAWTLNNWMLEDHLDVWLSALTPDAVREPMLQGAQTILK